MALPDLSTPPPAPARTQDPATFNTNVAAFLSWLETFGIELDAFVAALPGEVQAQIAAAVAAYDPDGHYTSSEVDTLLADKANLVQLAAKASLSGGNTFSGRQRVSMVTLTDAATVTPNLANGNVFTLILGGNRALANPTGMADAVGQEVLIIFRGAYQPTFGTFYKFPRGLAPTFSGTLNAIGGTVISTTEILMHGGEAYA